jgi:Ca-activated chloride channel homolog
MSPLIRKAVHVSLNAHVTLFLVFVIFVISAAAQQEGASSAAASRTRYLSESGLIPSSREVAVEEIINYHRHQIGRPKAGEAVAMDVRWESDQSFGNEREAILQVGFSTALANDRQQLRPINLALVIDKSGSMAASDKISRVKDALLVLISQLRESDFVSIVVFDSGAQVLLPSRPLGDKEYVRQLIRQIEPGSSTNMHAGLMLGYHEALKNFRKEATNRVILLTDGIANQGVTNPEEIAQNSLKFNDMGIDLSTIGVGLDLNKDLLRLLAKSGRGLFHFVADNEDISKVFLKEVQSLVSPVATSPNLEIEYARDLEVVKVYGYDPKIQNGLASLKLDNMNQGLTQVVLLRFRRSRHSSEISKLPVKVRLSYYDLERKKQVVKTEETFINPSNDSPAGMLRDNEVSKNYSIALLAQAIRDMAASCEAQRYKEAENLLTAAIAQTYQRYPNLDDEDISRTLMIAQKYQEIVRKYNLEHASKSDR